MTLPLVQQGMEAYPEFKHPSIRKAPYQLKAKHVLVTSLSQKAGDSKVEWSLR